MAEIQQFEKQEFEERIRKLEKENKKLQNENLLLRKLGREEKKEKIEIVNGKALKRV